MNYASGKIDNCKYIPADFDTIQQALDYASLSGEGAVFYSGKGEEADKLTYSDLRVKARALASRMLSSGLEPGDRAGLVAETDADFLIAFFACQYAGIVPAPLPLPATFGGKSAYIEHLAGMISVSGAKLILGPVILADMIAEVAAVTGVSLAGHLGMFDEAPEDPAGLPAVSPDDLSYIQFSSGSTRFPSGVAVTHRALMANVQAITRHGLMIGAEDRCMSWLPMYHDMGLVGFVLTPVATQMSVDYVPTREFARRPLVWPQLISRNRCTLSFSPSFGYDLCARRAQRMPLDELDLSCWRGAGIGGDMVRPDVLARFAEAFAPARFDARAFVASYGMAEATLAISFAPLDTGIEAETVDLGRLEDEQVAVPAAGEGDARARDFVRCGKVLAGHELEIRAIGSGRVLPDGEVGRVMFRGPSLMREYFADPEATAAAVTADGWLDTGDLGYMRDGTVVITGRSKDLILVNGRNIWPQDIEWAVEAEVEALRDGDVAAFPVDDGASEQVVLAVHCRKHADEERAALRQAVVEAARAHIGIDCRVELLPPNSLPRTSSGKLSRAGARKLVLARRANMAVSASDAAHMSATMVAGGGA